jgi:hypothetical protein
VLLLLGSVARSDTAAHPEGARAQLNALDVVVYAVPARRRRGCEEMVRLRAEEARGLAQGGRAHGRGYAYRGYGQRGYRVGGDVCTEEIGWGWQGGRWSPP